MLRTAPLGFQPAPKVAAIRRVSLSQGAQMMAIKATTHELCQRCGQRDAKLVGGTVFVGHDCPEGPPGPKGCARSLPLSSVRFVRSERHIEFLEADLAGAEVLHKERSQEMDAAIVALEEARRRQSWAFERVSTLRWTLAEARSAASATLAQGANTPKDSQEQAP